MKRKKPNGRAGPASPSAEHIASIAGVSIQLVYKKLRQGKTASQIVAEAHQRREQIALRGLPTVPVKTNGHAATNVVSFAQAQAEKENWLCELRRIEVMKARKELMPVSYVRLWGTRFLIAARDELLRGPGELADELAAERDPRRCEAILRRWVEHVLRKFCETERLWGPPIEGDAA